MLQIMNLDYGRIRLTFHSEILVHFIATCRRIWLKSQRQDFTGLSDLNSNILEQFEFEIKQLLPLNGKYNCID